MKSKEKLLNILNNYKLADKGNGDFLTNDYQDKILKPIYDDLDKLEEYKKIEEELGCPLDVLFEAIKNGIYFINESNELEYIDEALCFNYKINNNKFIFDNYGFKCLNNEKDKNDEIYLEDYSKTWWLKEDKSE